MPLFVRRSKLKVKTTNNSYYNLGYFQHSNMATQANASAMTKLSQNLAL